MANKKTKREFFGEIREIVKENTELVEFIDHELELLDKKTSAKSTKVNTEQVELMEKIVNALNEIGRSITISELQKENAEMAEYSNQKLSAMLKKLVDNKQVTKMIDKKKSYFMVAETPEVEGEQPSPYWEQGYKTLNFFKKLLTNDLKSSIIIIEVKERELISMEIKVNNKVVKIPQKEIDNLMKTLELTEQEAIETWLDDNDYTTNEQVEELTKKAKANGTTKIGARVNVENKKVERERKENPTKAFIIDQLWQKLAEIEHISNLKVENKEKLITFSLNGNDYKLDLVQKRAKKA